MLETPSRFGVALLLAAAVVIFYQVVVPPFVGLADNGDFGRITWFYRLVPENETDPDRYFRSVVGRYRYDPTRPIQLPEGPTSQHLTVAVPFLANLLFSRDGFLDIRAVGVMHGGLMLLALYLALPILQRLSRWRRVAASVLLVLVFTDVGYVQYFNSLYTDTAAVLYLLLTVVVGLRLLDDIGARRVNYALFSIFLALFILSKAQHSLLGLPVLAGAALMRPWPGRVRVGVWAGAMVALIGFAITLPGREYKLVASYNVLFLGILPNVASPEAALDEFGLDPWMSSYKGTSAYVDTTGLKSPLVRQKLAENVSQFRIAMYFLRHPQVALTLISKALSEAASQRLDGWGNFTKNSGREPGESSQNFSWWSQFRTMMFKDRPLVQLAFLTLSTLALIGRFARQRQWRHAAAGLILPVMAVMALGIGCLADVLDPQRHLFVFTVIVDVVFVLACTAWLRQSQPFNHRSTASRDVYRTPNFHKELAVRTTI